MLCAHWDLTPLLGWINGQRHSSGALPDPRGALPRGSVVSTEVAKHQEGSLALPMSDACSSAWTVWPTAVLRPAHIHGHWQQSSSPQLPDLVMPRAWGKAAELLQLCGDPEVLLRHSFRSYLWPSVLWEHHPETDPSASACLPLCSWLLTLTTLDICGLAWQLLLHPGWWLREQLRNKAFLSPASLSLAITAILGA